MNWETIVSDWIFLTREMAFGVEPIVANNRQKTEIYEISRQNYLKVAANRKDEHWGFIKARSNPRPKEFLNKLGPGPIMELHEGYFDYNQDGIWVSFANKHLGGGYLGEGWVQEEIITAEFYEMALGIRELEKINQNLMAPNEVYLWGNLLRSSVANPVLYGGFNIRGGKYKSSDYLTQNQQYQAANFLSMDAIRKDPRASYTLAELRHLFIKAISGFEVAVGSNLTIIHTGGWGAGVFGNLTEVILLVQALAAWLTGATAFHYWGYKDVKNKQIFDEIWNVFDAARTSEFNVVETYNYFANKLGIRWSLEEILGDFLSGQVQDLNWYWLDNNGTWVPYNADVQDILKGINSVNEVREFEIGGTRYKVYKRSDGWIQEAVNPPVRRRKVKAPL